MKKNYQVGNQSPQTASVWRIIDEFIFHSVLSCARFVLHPNRNIPSIFRQQENTLYLSVSSMTWKNSSNKCQVISMTKYWRNTFEYFVKLSSIYYLMSCWLRRFLWRFFDRTFRQHFVKYSTWTFVDVLLQSSKLIFFWRYFSSNFSSRFHQMLRNNIKYCQFGHIWRKLTSKWKWRNKIAWKSRKMYSISDLSNFLLKFCPN